jgi:TonB-linked SusC/RagA family outer membrane protein
MKIIKSIFVTLLLFTAFWASAQNVSVKGCVKDSATGEPIPFASIQLKGTMTGGQTDADGNYTMNVPSNAVLVFSSLGYVSLEEAVNGRAIVDVTLAPDTQMLDETVVVAFGTSTKEAFTGSATVVKSSDIAKVQTSEPTRALEGLVAGVQMTTSSGSLGASPSIIIRGIGTMSASSTPLYVVDGVPYGGDLNNINSADIESMTVLKDAASNSLYGARGANGVIMITTKKAKQSNAMINVDAKWGLNTRALQNYDLITDPGQYYESHYGALMGYYKEKNPSMNELLANVRVNELMRNQLQYIVYKLPAGEQLILRDGTLNPAATLGNVITNPVDGKDYLLYPDNWLDKSYRNSFRQEYNVSVSGSSGAMSMFASFGYLTNQGIILGSDMRRYTARFRMDYQAREWLKVGANLSYSNFDWDNGNSSEGDAANTGNVFAVASVMAPIYPLYVRDADGNILYDEREMKRYDYGNTFGLQNGGGYTRPNATQANPVSDMQLNINNFEGNAFNVTGFAEASFLKDFKFTFNAGVNLDETRSTTLYNRYYGQFAANGGVVEKGHSRLLDLNLQQLLSWDKSFGAHHVGVLVGHEWQKNMSNGVGASKSQLSSGDKDELNSAVIDNKTSYSSESFYNVEGFFLRAQYDFSEKIFASASYRVDASSNFSPKHRWGHFWSLGAGWLIDRESWFDAHWVDMLKLKASVGSQGNDGIGSNRYLNTWGIRNFQGLVGASPEAIGNDLITWETNTNLNIGTDFEFFKGKLSGSVEYFYRMTSDMLYFFSYPMSTGYSGIYDNVGDMSNTGIEVALSGNIMRRKDFSWDAYLNFTHYANKIVSIPEKNRTDVVEGHAGFVSGASYVGEGLPINTFYLKRYAGVEPETGLSQWYVDTKDASGNTVQEKTTNYNAASYYLCGNPIPDLYGGFGTSLAYRGFNLSVAFTYQIGGVAYDSGYATFMASPIATNLGSNYHKDLLKSWTPDAPSTEIPRFQYDDNYTAASSDRFLTNASYLNFQNAQLGYTLPRHITERIRLAKMRVYVTCDNIWYVSCRKGFDPRFSMSGTSNYAVNSPVRTVSGGISLTF